MLLTLSLHGLSAGPVEGWSWQLPMDERELHMVAFSDSLSHEAHPDSIPFEINTPLERHLLRLPATVLQAATLPVKWSLIWFEQEEVDRRLMNFFLNDDRTAGFYPVFSSGGRTRFSGGMMFFNRNLFNRGHSADVDLYYAGNTNLKAGLNYLVPPDGDRRHQIDVSASMRRDDEENYYTGGNGGDKNSSAYYEIEDYQLKVSAGYLVRPDLMVMVNSNLRHAVIAGHPGSSEKNWIAVGVPGYGRSTILGAGLSLTYDQKRSFYQSQHANLVSRVTTRWDFKQVKVGTYSGSLFDGGIGVHRGLENSDFGFLSYYGEWQYFVPLPGLPSNRRLAFKARIDKTYPLGEGLVPFFEQPMLGDAGNLRGYAQDRFWDLGSLLFTLEYRYPIWDTWDAVIFTDQGQVFNRYSDIGLDEFHGACGTGFHFMSSTDFIFRFEIAFSRETARSLLAFTMNF